MAESLTCHACGNVGFDDGSDGFFYCLRCGSQAEDIIDTGVADEDFVERGGDARGAIYLASHRRSQPSTVIKVEPLSQYEPQSHRSQSKFWDDLTLDHDPHIKKEELREETVGPYDVGPSGPTDFGSSFSGSRLPSFDDYYSEVRIRYVMGIQIMIQLQCEALVQKFGVTPLICGLTGSIWLRFVASSRVFDDGWADEAIQDSEIQKQGESENSKPRAKYSAEPHNIHGQRAVMIWYRSLRKRISLSCSLAVSFLACHLAREAVLPTDILKWSLEGKLPYFAAFVEIEKHIGHPSSACPLSSSFMFRPSQPVPLQKLESMAASVAESIGLVLPPVNFHAIASRYLKQLSLPVENILPHACRIHEWSMPPDLWLSASELRLPTRVCVLSILIVAIRILYNINGFGKWEMSLSSPGGSISSSTQIRRLDSTCISKMSDDAKQGSPSSSLDDSSAERVRNSSHVEKSELDAVELLCKLEARYDEIDDTYEYSKDLPTYLQYCKDVVFAGLEPSFEDHEEKKIIEQLWDFYQTRKDSEPTEDLGVGCSSVSKQKRSRDDEGCVNNLSKENKKNRDKGCIRSPSADNETSHVDDCPQQSLDGDDSSPRPQGDPNSEPSSPDLTETLKDKAIRLMKSDMEENRFCYIPPRVNLKRFDYLHYVRKKDEGSLTYVAHADYYILLRACARAAQVDVRSMHAGALSLERRLAWVENRIDQCLHLTPSNASCEFCNDVTTQHAADDSIGFSQLNL